MPGRLLLLVIVVLVTVGHGRDLPAQVPTDGAAPDAVPDRATGVGAAIGLARTARCLSCHQAAAGVVAAPALAPAPRLPLSLAPTFRRGGTLAQWLGVHHGGGDAAALAAFVRDAVGTAPPPADAQVGAGAFAQGERHWQEFGCIACHDQGGIDGLGARVDHAALCGFLRTPNERRPDLVHDFALSDAEAQALAAFLLRDRRAGAADGAAAATTAGLAFECFELAIDDARLPALDGLEPAARGIAPAIDVSMRTRDDDFALRFTGWLSVPQDGAWTFAIGSDDSSWLWIDDELLVANEALAPHRRRRGTVTLAAGAHRLRVVYTEARGDQSLELLWQGPGTELEPVPSAALAMALVALTGPGDAAGPPAATAVAAGRAAYAARRCGACHELAGAPPPAPSPAWADLGDGTCPADDLGARVAAALRPVLAAAPTDAVLLAADLAQHGCWRCHARDGRGGVAAAARPLLVETEDLGDEGRLPPDLTAVGHRLRPGWLESVLVGDARARTYVQVRMPKVPPALAAALAHRFDAVDGRPGDDDEPGFSAEAVERGRVLAGTGGKNCGTCHPFAGRRALGPQGMDLAVQHRRLRPAWFREWLLQPLQLRPGTRMPALWWRGDDRDRSDVDALRTWSRLGASAPVPDGYVAAGRYLLDPTDRPILHGAFLDGLSARCLCTGSPRRGHSAYDLEHCRLAWLWRGPFLDAAGTWHGRAGGLLRPLGDDVVELDDLAVTDLDLGDDDAAAGRRRCLGQRRDGDGYPVFRVAVGAAELEDAVVPRLTGDGVEFVRTLRCVRGRIVVPLQAHSGGATVTVGDAPAAPCELGAGEHVEVVYRW